MCKNVLRLKFRNSHICNAASAPYPLLIFLCLDSVPVHSTKYLISFSYIRTAFHTSVVAIGSYTRQIYTMIAHSQFSMGHARVRDSIFKFFLESGPSLAHHACDFQAVKLPECDLAFLFYTSRGVVPRERISSISLTPLMISDHESELSSISLTPLDVNPRVSSNSQCFTSQVPFSVFLVVLAVAHHFLLVALAVTHYFSL